VVNDEWSMVSIAVFPKCRLYISRCGCDNHCACKRLAQQHLNVIPNCRDAGYQKLLQTSVIAFTIHH
jgi:hypothetical protein